MLQINKRPLANEDLINIWIFTYENWGADQADLYLDRMEEKIFSLAENPKKYRLRQQFTPAVRICPHESHIIIYIDDSDSIDIIRVLHDSMDTEQHI